MLLRHQTGVRAEMLRWTLTGWRNRLPKSTWSPTEEHQAIAQAMSWLVEPLVKGILINYREWGLKWLRGWRKQRLRVLGWFGLKGSLGLDLMAVFYYPTRRFWRWNQRCTAKWQKTDAQLQQEKFQLDMGARLKLTGCSDTLWNLLSWRLSYTNWRIWAICSAFESDQDLSRR